MKSATVIDALTAGRATQEQRDWAKRRVAVLRENAEVFGELLEIESSELQALLQALASGRSG